MKMNAKRALACLLALLLCAGLLSGLSAAAEEVTDVPVLEAVAEPEKTEVIATAAAETVAELLAPETPAASVKLRYKYLFYDGQEYNWTPGALEAVNCTTLQEAFAAAENQSYLSELPAQVQQIAADNPSWFYYDPAIVTLLQDATVDTAMTINCSVELDLNGYSFNLAENGVLAGDGWLTLCSTTPGIFTSCGTIALSGLGPWTADTVNILGGTVSGYLGVDGGTVNILGGEVIGGFMFNNGGAAPIKATISGDARIADLSPWSFVIYAPVVSEETTWNNIHLTLDGGYYSSDPRILFQSESLTSDRAEAVMQVVPGYRYYTRSGDSEANYVYTPIDPAAVTEQQLADNEIFLNYRDFVTVDEDKIEQYAGQNDWAADPEAYPWRIADSACAPEEAVASVTQRYSILTQSADGYDWVDYDYATLYYPTLQAAFLAAAKEPAFKDQLEGLPEQESWFNYCDPLVTLLKDVTIAEGETVTCNSAVTFFLDLNGKTLTVDGTLVGRQYFSESEYMPSRINVMSTTPGVFRSSGMLELMLEPWTADEYFITGGTFAGMLDVMGGNFTISGGHVSAGVYVSNNSDMDADLYFDVSGDAEIDSLYFSCYYAPDAPKCRVTVSENARIASLRMDLRGSQEPAEPILYLNGGYYNADPGALLPGYYRVPDEEVDRDNLDQYFAYRGGSYVPYSSLSSWQASLVKEFYLYSETRYAKLVVFGGEPEQYANQTDWTADSASYPWRVATPAGIPGDINGDEAVNAKDVTYLRRSLAGGYGVAVDEAVADVNKDGAVNAKDVTYLRRALAGGYGIALG